MEKDDYASTKRSKFRFKSQDQEEDPSSSSRRHHRRRHHHRSKRPKPTLLSRSPSPQPPPLSPSTAFRESLFDALADDEGAAYWESVYGQPIHTYTRSSGENGGHGQGELEQMTDEEYAAYVRARMWERTHQAAFEERERRRRKREKEEEEEEEEEAQRAKGRKERRRRGEGEEGGWERDAFDRLVDESLRRGEERRERKKRGHEWLAVWRRYLDSWEELNERARNAAAASSGGSGSGTTNRDSSDKLRNLIVWPVESGKRRDISPATVEEFIRNAPLPDLPPSSSQQQHKTQNHLSDRLTVLKIERVRWHPDKMQHRYSVLGMEEQVIKSATMVFQILDRLWGEERGREKGRAAG
ncbi:hypothetical protein AJ80_05457 [Polytolypa hystricis UAMH7299]|uniref:Uncharacterized protein n=1 Tax=Polytolypa hystricis (strain UAMH7299) TaxID=1447883 RepID=A0A2B7Y3M6_POLH7|nr:hypothetical protein AJ80_05457 [Polytolypa hystricis UAMH7299]